MKYYAIPSNNSSVTEKHMVEDDILFTNPLAGKGLNKVGLELGRVRSLIIGYLLMNGVWKTKQLLIGTQ